MKNSIDHANFINKEYKEYLKSTFYMNDVDYQTSFEKAVDSEPLYNGPILNIDLPYKRSKNINELISDGVIHPLFNNLKGVDMNRPLYLHQENALKQIADGQSLVITTGTGSGKTESFLYPIINEIIKLKSENNNSDGIKALFLYPMNALVNDQMRRVREMLSGTGITYGMYTGDTVYKIDSKLRENLEENELASREEIINNPPDILFVNYSMLEYMMIRPVEQKLFSKEVLRNWKFMVLDEAHSYNSALGIELSYLLRRVQGWANKSPQFILTSATLGEEGKSNKEIVEFAVNLTSVSYNEDNIIFAKRDIFSITPTMHQDPDIYVNKRIEFLNNEPDDSKCEEIYDLIVKDRNVVEFKKAVDTKKTFELVLEHMSQYGFNSNSLSAFIDCITIAKKNAKELFSIRYHMFIKSLAGAFITLGDDKSIAIKKTYKINGKRAFEIGLCKQCNEIYIIGEVRRNAENINTLYFKGDIDIYEDYEEEVGVVKPSFYLINKPEDESLVEEFKICSVCGFIHESNMNMEFELKCTHDKSLFVSIYKVESSEHSTNLTKCGCCHATKKQGVINDFTLGKDNSTAILSQLYFDTISTKKELLEKEFNFFDTINGESEKQISDDVAQILTFSDSRQQASFFAKFSEVMHKRFVRKKFILEKVNDDITKLDVMAEAISTDIKKYEIYDEDITDYDKEGYFTVLYELLKVDGDLSGEGLGLYSFSLNIDDIKKQVKNLSDEQLSNSLNVKLTKNDLYNSFNVISNVFRITPAICYSSAGISSDIGIQELIYRGYKNFVCLNANKNEKKKNVRSLLPINKDNNLTLYFKKAFSINEDVCNKFIKDLFRLLVDSKVLKTEGSSSSDYKIPYTNFSIMKGNSTKWYACSKCKKLTTININNCCLNGKCIGTLIECDPNVYFENNYYRKKYMNQNISRFVAKEHTGAINKSDAKSYQQDFIDKKINLLSCSTTFEMGIDLGGLNYVFMRNVPPTPANYIQRAGRAGRRSNATPFVLTYCSNNSHDFHYFNNPLQIISGAVNPPIFKIDNEKIMLRHLMSTVLAFYFRTFNVTVNNIGDFILDDYIKLKDYINSNPNELNNFIEKHILTGSLFNKYNNYKWVKYLILKDSILEVFYSKFISNIQTYKDAMNNDPDKAYIYQNQIKKNNNTNFIEAFSRDAVIPKYGFPTDVVYLYQNDNGIVNYDSNFSRDLKMAIVEYAPDCEVMNNKIKYKSKYINLSRSSPLTELYTKTCPKCELVYRSIIDKFPEYCESCDIDLFEVKSQTLIIPIHGFIADFKKSVSSNVKPKRSAAGDFQYIGNSESSKNVVLSENIIITASKEDELLIRNYNSFYTCDSCGFTEKNSDNKSFEKISSKHKCHTGGDCQNEILRKIDLGYILKTDVIKISINKLSKFNKSNIYSTLYALLNGIEIVYGIEKNAFNGIVQATDNTVNYIIFDTIPGGAGLVSKLMNVESLTKVFEKGLESVSKECCDIDASCDNCLRSYYNQSKHEYLRRISAIDFINYILTDIKEG